MDFTRDENKMNQLFEAFVLNFYKREYPKWKVTSPKINWKLEAIDEESDLNFLPEMRTDITIDKGFEKVIIDTKYYRSTLNSFYGSESVKSENLYQIFSYLLNQRDGTSKTENATGILLYPTIKQDYDLEYKYQNHPIHIKTINLNMNWKRIEDRLKNIIEDKHIVSA